MQSKIERWPRAHRDELVRTRKLVEEALEVIERDRAFKAACADLRSTLSLIDAELKKSAAAKSEEDGSSGEK